MNVAIRTTAKQSSQAPKGSEGQLRSALFREIAPDGVYARTALYEEVVDRLAAFITRQRESRTEVLRFPPVMSRRDLEKAGYLKSFPNLLGCVCALHGPDADIRAAVRRFEAGDEWTDALTPAELVFVVESRGPEPVRALIQRSFTALSASTRHFGSPATDISCKIDSIGTSSPRALRAAA